MNWGQLARLVYITADATFIVGGATGQSRATSIRAMGQIHSSQFTALSMVYAWQGRMWTQPYHLATQLGELSWLPHGVPQYEK